MSVLICLMTLYLGLFSSVNSAPFVRYETYQRRIQSSQRFIANKTKPSQPTIDLHIYFVYEEQNHLRGVIQSELDELKMGSSTKQDILFSVIGRTSSLSAWRKLTDHQYLNLQPTTVQDEQDRHMCWRME